MLDLAGVVRIGAEFSAAEQGRARAAAARDPRLRVTLDATGYGLTQTLAAAPQLVARWEGAQASAPYGWAVLTAALDASRLGARGPLSAQFLRAAPGYCTSQQQAEAPDTWFKDALAYATGKLHGAAAALSAAGIGMGQIAGYTAADYLIQHASQERRSARVPASTWDALISHMRDPADTARLADSAENRLLYRYAIPLYWHAANVDDQHAARQLARLLAEHGDLDGLRARADAGDWYAAELAGGPDPWRTYHILRASSDLDDEDEESLPLAWTVPLHINLDRLRARADAGEWYAAGRLAELLAGHGDLDEAEQILRAQPDETAARQLAGLLAAHGHMDEATWRLCVRADAGEEYAALQLAERLAARGDLDEAEQILHARADAGDRNAARALARLLAEGGDVDGLRALADAGNGYAAWALPGLLAEHGDVDGLRALTDAGDGNAASKLPGLLISWAGMRKRSSCAGSV